MGEERRANHRIRIAFVATNSIVQGEQVAQLWPLLFDRFGLEIMFAHRTFSWGSEARGKAHVHVVIVGLAHRDHEPDEKRLFSYPDIKGDPVESRHAALTAYLFDARAVANRHLVVKEESKPINGAGNVVIGSKPIDGSNYIFEARERADFLAREPGAKAFMHPYLGGHEFINGGNRSILYLGEASPIELRKLPLVMERIARVRAVREASNSAATRALAAEPTRYHVTVVPKRPYLVIPKVSSERREYVPMGWLRPPTIASDLLFVQADATLCDFAILTSRMHMAWLSHIGGRLESRFRYSI
ncbi:MAG TPA: type IIL restriction-modification enzyme MmeI, partial [Burkholderiales bacterium]|nr:type IIL restriction-modification enzyme MmeI [Burkholderiales bacterium]